MILITFNGKPKATVFDDMHHSRLRLAVKRKTVQRRNRASITHPKESDVMSVQRLKAIVTIELNAHEKSREVETTRP